MAKTTQKNQEPLLDGIYSGLDANAISGLFRVIDGEPQRIEHAEWCRILSALGANAGELICVKLSREPANRGESRWD